MTTGDHDRNPQGPGHAGSEEMNAEHHVQLSLLYALREAVSSGQGGNAQEILERLVDYSKMHFASEQLLMRLYQYGDYEAHLGEHEKMLDRLEALRVEQAAGHDLAVAGGLDAIDAGLVAHIHSEDRTLGRYLAHLPHRPKRSA
jgi:hemerythrin